MVSAVVRWVVSNRQESAFQGLDCLTAMRIPILQYAFDRLGFEPAPYTFTFVCHALDPSLPAAATQPENWYVTPGD